MSLLTYPQALPSEPDRGSRWQVSNFLATFGGAARICGRPLRPKHITSFVKAFKRVCRLARCPGRIPHDLRRTAVSLERAGVPRSVAMKLTGHKTESVYRRCAIADDDLRVAVERLDTLRA